MKPVKYKKNYLVYPDGRIYNTKWNRFIKITKVKDSYDVCYCSGKNMFLHRILAECFIDNPYNKPQVNHKDGNKQNNNLNNLEWTTASENQRHRYNSLNGTYYKKSILQLDKNGNVLHEWSSQLEPSIKLGIHQSAICNVCNGKRKTAGGFVWKYEK